MTRSFKPIPVVPLQNGATFMKPKQAMSDHVRLEDPAFAVMTDFSVVTAYKISPLESIESARTLMIHYGVRMLFVVDDLSHVLGLITSTDLTGEKPMQIIQTQGIRHSDVLVKDIMTPREKLEVLCIDDVEKALVGDIIATMQKQGRQTDRSQVLRGMFSASQIARQVAMPIHTVPIAQTFAEIGAHLND